MRRLFFYAFQSRGDDGWSGSSGSDIALETSNEHALRALLAITALSQATSRPFVLPDWRLAAGLVKISFGLEFQAFAVVSTPLLLIPE